jgi:hypothetical protein
VRQGRIKQITAKEMIFANGHRLPTGPTTLHGDCSAASTTFSHPTIIFQGNVINLYLVMDHQQCYSSAIIAALETKFPDDEEKKNQVIPCGINNPGSFNWNLDGYFAMFRDQLLNQAKIGKMLGLSWILKSRLSGSKFFGSFGLVRLIMAMGGKGKQGRLVESLTRVLDVAK